VKTTMNMRNIANPRRTKLAQFKEAEELTAEAGAEEAQTAAPEQAEDAHQLPTQTANPRRTVLQELPTR
jgi:hypothetical protein